MDAALGLAERLRTLIEGLPLEIPTAEDEARVTISAGVAGIESVSGGSVADLIADADQAVLFAPEAPEGLP